MQQALVDSVALVEDSRSENVVEMLKRLYQHCRKKDATGEAHYRPDPHDRFLWASLATAAIHRSQSRGIHTITRRTRASSVLYPTLIISGSLNPTPRLNL